MIIRPVHNHIIAKKHINEPKSAGGILLTASGEDESTHAEVLAIGSAFKGNVKVGDIITYSDDKRVHTEKIENEYLLIMPEDCVLAVIEK
ncbi:Heat shock protein 60 family co-chaperone GroES [Yersinia phage fHe-Yen9-04]|uniref:Heat shock protein 60 family co-chaperone GroES n=2 Tax=Eneladusvirus Yen904 TaxID=2560849 RepID=A0A2C9CWL1_9CAUD|nr:co-chaperonin GroES [Yersinia phage fHe-Yen9-04]SOK58394.1 Heat shock protein 60 family co-chaperone GroES [Yersinia phage fHe-Yen9-04]SOK58929.1 Heat shock protein 60 family co-chaperone GroES [Yersinia phage fHe-Yen9-03]VUE36163.1 Heat shock protein 60 family co-chaperone GroES [Yersinia phage fHe-Yen9-04]